MLKMPPMTSLVGATIRNRHDYIGQYGQIIQMERKKGFSDLYEMVYGYLDDRINCTMKYNVAMYGGKLLQAKVYKAEEVYERVAGLANCRRLVGNSAPVTNKFLNDLCDFWEAR